MLEPGSLFALDAGNQRVPGVVVPTLEGGLQLVGHGRVASLVGRLRPALRVVDVDLSGDRGAAVVQSLESWCSSRGLWHLIRPSGGAPGRGHVYVAPAGQMAALEEVLTDLRRQHRAGPRTIDLRVAVRPLSAPHRTGAVTLPLGDLQTAWSSLRAVLGQCGTDTATASTVATVVGADDSVGGGRDSGPQRRAGSRSRLVPQRGTCTPMPAVWRDYLERGIRPQIAGDDTEKRSNYEAIATAALLRAGRDVDEAWAQILRAHPAAFTKARERGRSWWSRCVWEPAVRAHDRFTPLPARALAAAASARSTSGPADPAGSAGQPGAPAPALSPGPASDDVDQAVEAARAAVYAAAWALTPRSRPAFLLVMHTVLDRMARERSRRVPVPERDLVLDTGLTDRATIRAQLRRADGPVGRLDRSTWDSSRRDSSSFEFEIPPADSSTGARKQWGGTSQSLPPSSHTPSGSGVPPGLWAALPSTAHQLWRALITCVVPVSLEDLGALAQVMTVPGSRLSARQVRVTRTALAALADVGLAACTADGGWVAHLQCTSAGARVIDVARRRRAAAAAAVQQERAEYRAGLHKGRVWDAQRAAALKANRAREVAWWEGLSVTERAARSGAWVARYRSLTVYEQQQVKRQLAERRVRAGVDEHARHDGWLDGLRMDDLVRRAVTRASWFAALPRPKQQAYASMWAQHRSDYGIPRGTPLATSRLEFSAALPHSPGRRDDAFLDDQLPLQGLEVSA